VIPLCRRQHSQANAQGGERAACRRSGGFSLSSFSSTPVKSNQVRYNGNFGALIVEATDASMTFGFWSIANGGTLIDSYTLNLPGANLVSAGGNDTLTGDATPIS
jgi:hypothetical protein